MEELAIEPDVTLNLVGLTCPGPIIGTKKMIDELQQGQILLLISDCPGTQDDLYAWAHNTGNRVLKVERYADGSNGFFIQHGARTHRSANVSLDMRGSVCPGPILEARKLLHGMASGEVLRLVSNCPGSRDDVADWTRETGLELVEVIQTGAHEYEFFIRKPHAAEPGARGGAAR
jgi:TusA-related sulfurtransferase